MTAPLPFSLMVKSMLIGSPLEEPLLKWRWWLSSAKRRKHPELWELYLEERRLPLVLAKLLKRDSCGVDVGCHIGSFLRLLKTHAPDGRHLAFEASPTKSRWLSQRFRDVEIIDCAVGDESGSALFVEDRRRPGYSHLKRKEGEEPTDSFCYPVQICRLDDVLADAQRIDIIKIDIEGNELAALRGGRLIIEKWQPAIIFECGPEVGFKNRNLDRGDIFRFILDDLGYVIYGFGDFIFDKGPMEYNEFRKCGLYPFRALNFVALPSTSASASQIAGKATEH